MLSAGKMSRSLVELVTLIESAVAEFERDQRQRPQDYLQRRDGSEPAGKRRAKKLARTYDATFNGSVGFRCAPDWRI